MHAFRTEIKNNGVLSLYQGCVPFLLTHATFVAVQFAIYEKVIQTEKRRLGHEKYHENEFRINCFAGLLAGSIAAALTNSFESITVAKQTNPSTNIIKMVREDGAKLLTRGLVARVVYNGGQSFVFFNVLLLAGKVFNVDLSEE